MFLFYAAVKPFAPKQILESGRARGKSTLVLARCFPDARIVSVEYDRQSENAAAAAQQFFERAGNLERDWRSRLAAARAALAAGNTAAAREMAARANVSIAQLQQKWDSENYASYSRRPDIQFERAQLARLTGR